MKSPLIFLNALDAAYRDAYPAEALRRWFMDLPGAQQKETIWRLYIDKFRLDADQPTPPDFEWTGAEIRACCRLAALMDVSLVEAALNVVPVAATAAESVDRLREWAHGRCLTANEPGGIYTRDGSQASSSPMGRFEDPF